MGIENIIAATVGENALTTAFGEITMDRILAHGKSPSGRIFLTVPAWSIELFPERPEEDYLWQGQMKIAESRRLSGIVSLTLDHDSGQHLHVSLSIREAENAGNMLTSGAWIPVGIRVRGVNWVPDKEP